MQEYSQLQDIEPANTERGVFVGRTGSGKSVLAKAILQYSNQRLIIIDPKHEIFVRNAQYISNSADLKTDFEGTVIYRNVDFDDYETLFAKLFRMGNVRIFIDEVYALSPDHRKYPVSLQAIYTRGRSLRISVLACTQRPTWVPLYVISESEHHYVFNLNLAGDRQRMSEMMGEDVKRRVEGHQFWYFNTRMSTPILREYVIK